MVLVWNFSKVLAYSKSKSPGISRPLGREAPDLLQAFRREILAAGLMGSLFSGY